MVRIDGGVGGGDIAVLATGIDERQTAKER